MNVASRKIVEAGWESYRQNVLPKHAPQVQVDETRKGFYAGAWHLLTAIMSALEPGSDPTDADLRLMDDIHEELQAFARSKGV